MIHKNRLHTLLSAYNNTRNITASEVEFDLLTDSWPELDTSFINNRIFKLYQERASEKTLNEAISHYIHLPYIIPFAQGRLAEACLFKALLQNQSIKKRSKTTIIQNQLFPTTRYHQIFNQAVPKEISHINSLELDSNDHFKGNIDIEQLSKLLKIDDSIHALVIELSNNATGGYAVAIENLMQSYHLCKRYNVPVILDATRIMENAIIIQRHERKNQSIKQILNEISQYCDIITMSLGKDFAINKGGIIALKSKQLYQKINDLVLIFGNGLSRMDSNLIIKALDDYDHVVKKTQMRVEQITRLHHRLVSNGLPFFKPSGTHCLLLDVSQLDNFKQAEIAHHSIHDFLYALYLETGIRAGVHNSGITRAHNANFLVRFAIPLGISEKQINEIGTRLVDFLINDYSYPTLVVASKTYGVQDKLFCHYRHKENTSMIA